MPNDPFDSLLTLFRFMGKKLTWLINSNTDSTSSNNGMLQGTNNDL